MQVSLQLAWDRLSGTEGEAATGEKTSKKFISSSKNVKLKFIDVLLISKDFIIVYYAIIKSEPWTKLNSFLPNSESKLLNYIFQVAILHITQSYYDVSTKGICKHIM